MIELRNITKEYGDGDNKVEAIKGISVAFRDSEFVSVLGPSGCGKTTLMNLIGGLDKASSGLILVDGKSTADFSDSDWDDYRNKKIGFVFQSYNLINHLTVLGNVELALTLSGVSKKERTERAMQALEQVGIAGEARKKPNELSGGQMQRVAIARSIVNNPEILLADEPTGALDTVTSEQIMKILKDISKNRLVVMVTHNPDIANRYSTRIIKMLDGVVTSDSNPFDPSSVPAKPVVEQPKASDSKVPLRKSKMSFSTALSLSGRNLLTKKSRTIMTSVAGGIGIIGIALILAVSTGVNDYINNLTSDTLSSTPISITSTELNTTQAGQALYESLPAFPNEEEIYVQKTRSVSDYLIKNNITQEYIDYVKKELDPGWYNDILYKTGLNLDLYGFTPSSPDQYTKLDTNESSSSLLSSIISTSALEMLPKDTFTQSQYEVLKGQYPTDKSQVAIIVDKSNQIMDRTLIALGLLETGEEKTEYSFDEILGRTYKVVPNDLEYVKSGSAYSAVSPLDIDYSAAQTITISGILRINEQSKGGMLSTGIAYTKELYAYIQDLNMNSEIVAYMKANPGINPFSGQAYQPSALYTADEQYQTTLRSLGGNDLPNEIDIYPASLDAKDKIKKALDAYNTGKSESEVITYSDLSTLIDDTLRSVISVITYVLIAFTAISLVVSSIMIAINTSVSVIERTKEIGILRSIGARKRDVTNVFNAETFIIGTIAGLFGIVVTYLVEIPINIICYNTLAVPQIANLSIGSAAILVVISIAITLLSGLLPARKAAKQDPVVALRTE